MPRNSHERRGTSTWHRGTAADLSDEELRRIIAELETNEHGCKDKNSRKAIRKSRETYEAELTSRSDEM